MLQNERACQETAGSSFETDDFVRGKGLAWTLLTGGAAPAWRTSGDREAKRRNEEARSDHKTLQARRGEGGLAGGRAAGDHGDGGEGLRSPEGAHRTLSRR